MNYHRVQPASTVTLRAHTVGWIHTLCMRKPPSTSTLSTALFDCRGAGGGALGADRGALLETGFARLLGEETEDADTGDVACTGLDVFEAGRGGDRA